MFVGGVPVAALAGRRSIPPGTLWDPSVLGAALVEWFDPNQGIVLGAGSAIASWTGCNGTVASQPTTANRPTFSATARNGKPGILLNGNQALNFSAGVTFPYGSSASTLVVSGYLTPGATGTYLSALSWGAGSSNQTRSIAANSGNVYGLNYGANHSTSISWQGLDRCVVWQIPAGANPVTTFIVDGGTPSTASPSTMATPSGSTGGIGSGPLGVFNGVLQHLLVLNRLPTTNEELKIEGWESWVNGKAGANLPVGHPYKSRAPFTSDP